LVMRWADEAEVRSLANPVETASEDGA
jgi:hypothetical protein